MAKCVLILSIAYGLIIRNCLAKRTDRGSLDIRVQRLERKTDVLQTDVDDIWEKIHVQEYGNQTRTDHVGSTDKDCEAKMNNSEGTLKKLKFEVEHLVMTSRNGLKSEKHWQRKTIRNLRGMFEEFQTSVSTVLDNLNANQQKLETENEVLRQAILHMQTEISKKQDAITCDDDWKSFNGHCYLFVNEQKTWDDALAFCGNRNSYLIEIGTHEEFEFAADVVRHYNGHWFWIGATDREEEGTFVYQHSRQQLPKIYWAKGQPDNLNWSQHCVRMGRFSESFSVGLEFDDGGCNWHYYIACEKP